MDRRRVALLLVVVGALCLPAPQYLGWAAATASPPDRTAQVFAAEPIDVDDAADRRRFVDRHANEITLSDARLAARSDDGTYRSVNRLGVKPRGFPFPRHDLQTRTRSESCP
ncbi:hypothetical protein [Halorubrum amylolyticum]|uniref:hypothetical protein n=1 Tax=Halorubrum amylolyticum TaxID=2508724 RepID=UPI001008BA9F|nr:hypothetical protein [Halorubrum amylolyticum]